MVAAAAVPPAVAAAVCRPGTCAAAADGGMHCWRAEHRSNARACSRHGSNSCMQQSRCSMQRARDAHQPCRGNAMGCDAMHTALAWPPCRYQAAYRELAKKHPSFRERSETTELIVDISLQVCCCTRGRGSRARMRLRAPDTTAAAEQQRLGRHQQQQPLQQQPLQQQPLQQQPAAPPSPSLCLCLYLMPSLSHTHAPRVRARRAAVAQLPPRRRHPLLRHPHAAARHRRAV